jgi:hypothetical protein
MYISGVRRLTTKTAGERDEVPSVIPRWVESNNFLKRRSTEPLLAGRRLHAPVLLMSRLARGCVQPKERAFVRQKIKKTLSVWKSRITTDSKLRNDSRDTIHIRTTLYEKPVSSSLAPDVWLILC